MLGWFWFKYEDDEDVDGFVLVCASVGKHFDQPFLVSLLTSVVISISLWALIDERLICAPVVNDCTFLCCRMIIITPPNTMTSNVTFKVEIKFTTEIGYTYEGPTRDYYFRDLTYLKSILILTTRVRDFSFLFWVLGSGFLTAVVPILPIFTAISFTPLRNGTNASHTHAWWRWIQLARRSSWLNLKCVVPCSFIAKNVFLGLIAAKSSGFPWVYCWLGKGCIL